MATPPIEKTLMSLDELLALGSDTWVEIIGGELIAMSPVGVLHHIIVSNVAWLLEIYVRKTGVGSVFPDGLIYMMGSEKQGLKNSFVPDVSFIHMDSIPADWEISKPYSGAPDLAVEVMSPDDKAPIIIQKVRTYLEKGTREVWVIYPESRELHQYQQDSDTVRIYRGSTKLDSERLFPGIENLTTDAIFKLPGWAKS